jgi:hypothetical protein
MQVNCYSNFMNSLILNNQEELKMAKFLIEVPHGADKASCDQAIQIFIQTGSHFLTHADWGCLDGEHKAWIIADVPTKDDARMILPPAFRSAAKITRLATFTSKDLLQPETFHII